MNVSCKRCGEKVASYSPMRKWCVDCRRVISLEQARARKYGMSWDEKSSLRAAPEASSP